MTMGVALSKAETNKVELDPEDDIANAHSEAEKLFSVDTASTGKLSGDLSGSTASDRLVVKPRNQITKASTDDMLSKSTESTKGSPELGCFYLSRPFDPCSGRHSSSKSKIPGSIATALSRVGWFRSRSSSGHVKSSKTSQKDDLPPSILVINQMDPRRQNQLTLPVKCPRKSHHRRTSSSADEEDLEELQHIYDMRTWDMYLRITEARKNQQQRRSTTTTTTTTHNPSTNHHSAATTTVTQSDYDHFLADPSGDVPEEVLDTSTDHEMIFGDLE